MNHQIEDTGHRTEVTYRRLEDTRRRIEDTRRHLEDTRRHIEDTRRRIEDTRRRIEDTRRRIEDTRRRIEDTRQRRLISTMLRNTVSVGENIPYYHRLRTYPFCIDSFKLRSLKSWKCETIPGERCSSVFRIPMNSKG